MKRTSRIITLIMTIAMVATMSVPTFAQSKSYSASDTKTCKKYVKEMVSEMNYAAEAQLEKMKKGQTVTLDYSKRSARNFSSKYIYLEDKNYNYINTSRVSQRMFGPKCYKRAVDEEFYDGTDHVTLKIKSITRSGNYYTAKCKAMMYVDGTSPAYHNDGTVTLKFKVYRGTWYGMIIKTMKVTRTVDDLRPDK